jgi:hypothetical protein
MPAAIAFDPTLAPRRTERTERALPPFAALVEWGGWNRLAPAIRERFAVEPFPGRRVVYAGNMHRIDASLAGQLFALFCRLLGTPLPPFTGRDIEADIRLERHDTDGIVWTRHYRRGGRTIAVRSVKRVAEDGTLLECVGAGFGMRLRVYEKDGALHFVSTRYFFHIGRREIALPDLLTPGPIHVVHTDLGDGRFRFTLTARHKLLGDTFSQDGIFHDPAGGLS